MKTVGRKKLENRDCHVVLSDVLRRVFRRRIFRRRKKDLGINWKSHGGKIWIMEQEKKMELWGWLVPRTIEII